MLRSFALLCVFFSLPLLSGCGTFSYLMQAGAGQMELFNKAKPIPQVLKDPRTPTRIKKLLAEIPEIKVYGEAHGLRPTKNYQDYVKLNRSAAVYVVSAAEPLAFVSKEWSFPVVGTFPYLGWFHLDAAKDFARKLKAEGWDVDLRGAGAYSTLGWFRDSVLSTMISPGEEARGELVNVVIHESVHATAYVSGQAYFNESLANFVAGKMTPQYLQAKSAASDLAAYQKAEQEYRDAAKTLHEAYEKLDAIYKSSDPDAEKLERKKEILDALQKQMGWKREINNATLIQFKEYNEGFPDFDKVLDACAGDWIRFMTVMKTVKSSAFTKTQQSDLSPVLKPLELKCRVQ